MKESELKVWFRRNWEGWVESFEPRIGTGIGIPDLMVIVKERLVPIELKVGSLSEDGQVLYPCEVRAAQLSWHNSCNNAGVNSWFLVGVGDYFGRKPEHIFLVKPHLMRFWKDGIEIDNLIKVRVAKDKFKSDLRRVL
jgi:hypothetical protein